VFAECGLDSFDAWAATFGQTVAAVELALRRR
jgi:N12 class adenine-specific DNA methylase